MKECQIAYDNKHLQKHWEGFLHMQHLQRTARSMVKRIIELCKETYVIGIVREWETFSLRKTPTSGAFKHIKYLDWKPHNSCELLREVTTHNSHITKWEKIITVGTFGITIV